MQNKDIRKAFPLLCRNALAPLAGARIRPVVRQADPYHSPPPAGHGSAGVPLKFFSPDGPMNKSEWRDDCEFDELRIEDIRRRRGELVDEPGEEVDEEEVDDE
jgi:hypothetical protein